jgi:hypothetical protein
MLDAPFGSSLRLTGYTSDSGIPQFSGPETRQAALGEPIDLFRPEPALHPGQSISLTLFWQKVVAGGPDIQLDANVVDSTGRTAAHSTSPLLWGDKGSGGWESGAHATTRLAVQLPDQLAPGSYLLRLGASGLPQATPAVNVMQLEISR